MAKNYLYYHYNTYFDISNDSMENSISKIPAKTSERSASKSVRFTEETDKKFEHIAEKLGRNKQEVFAQMVDYFYKSKKDPSDLNDELLKKEISAGISRLISFIKTQEKDTLSPMLAEVREGSRQTTHFGKNLVDLVGQLGDDWMQYRQEFAHLYWQRTEGTQSKHGGQIVAMGKELTAIRQGMHTLGQREEALKTAFKALLESYMGKREQLNSLTQGKALKELQESTLQSIKAL